MRTGASLRVLRSRLWFPVLQKSDESYPLGAGNGADEGDLESDHFPDEGSFAIDDEFFDAGDGNVEVALGDRRIVRGIHSRYSLRNSAMRASRKACCSGVLRKA